MEEKLISVIVPVYKVEEYICQCVDSILNQTYPNLEVILVDDESPDNCPWICEEYACRDSRVRVIHQANGGVSAARNTGIEQASGSYLMFVDSDDYLAPDCIEKLLQNLNGCRISECGVTYVDDVRFWYSQSGTPVVLDWKSYLTETGLGAFLSYAVVWGKLYERSLFSDIRFPVGCRNGEDEATEFKLAYFSGKISRIYDNLYFYRQREQGASKNYVTEKRIADAKFLFAEKIEFFRNLGRKDMEAFFLAKRAVCFTGFYRRTEEPQLQQICKNVCREHLGTVLAAHSVPIKYKLYIVSFLLSSIVKRRE